MSNNRIPYFNHNNLTPGYVNNWITELHNAGLSYHFDDDPRDVIKTGEKHNIPLFTERECKTLDSIMESIYSMDNYDPFEQLVKLTSNTED